MGINLIAIPLVAAATLLTSCGQTTQPEGTAPFDISAYQGTTLINGTIPEGVMAPMVDVTSLIDTTTSEGQHLIVTRGIRPPSTRAGIHIHQWGGYTCVESGVITDFIEGKEPAVFEAGTCYYMPADTLMSAANLGTEPAVLVDNFVIPYGEETVNVVESGWDEAVIRDKK